MPKSTGEYYNEMVASGLDHDSAMVKVSQVEFLASAYAESGRDITEDDVEKLAGLPSESLDELVLAFQKEAGFAVESEGLTEDEAYAIADAVEKRANAWIEKIAAERGGDDPENDDGEQPKDDKGFQAKMEAEMRRDESGKGKKEASFDSSDPKIAGFELLSQRDAVDQLVATGMLEAADDGNLYKAASAYEETRFVRTLELMHSILTDNE